MLSDPPTDDSTLDTDEDAAKRHVPHNQTINSFANEGVTQESDPVAVRILRKYFQRNSKKHSLLQHMRLHIGPKQYILNAILQMTYDEFCKYTHMYPSDILYTDEAEIAKCYQYAICDPAIWPANLYIRLADIREYLQRKRVHLHEMDLRCITPSVLHWCDLVTATNFDQCVQYDYYKTEGKTAMTLDVLHQRRKSFYERCWETGEWLWRAPDVTQVQIAQQVVEANAESQYPNAGTDTQVVVTTPNSGTALNDTSVRRTALMDCRTSEERGVTAANSQESCPTKRALIGAGAHLSEDVLMRCIRARVSDSSKHAYILQRIQRLLRSKGQQAIVAHVENVQNFVEFTDEEKRRHTLEYALRLHIGPTQYITQAIRQMTCEEFRQYTHMYPSDILYRDAAEIERLYKYAICEGGIWPSNLYIRLKDLPAYLQRKGVRLHEWDLRCITPLVLHWCDLMTATNFDACVQYDYYKTEGRAAMDVEELPQRREDFYERCWKAGEWLWRPPDVTDAQLLEQMAEPKDLTQTTILPTQTRIAISMRQTNECGDTTAAVEAIATNSSNRNAAHVVSTAEPNAIEKSSSIREVQGSDDSLEIVRICDEMRESCIAIQQVRKTNIRDLFFQFNDKRHSLHYHLRLSIGPRQCIIGAILQMTFDEFCQYVNMYNSGSMCGTGNEIRMCYEYAICEPAIWPPNLYIRLENLKEYLQRKRVHLHKMDLRCITPIVLHWYDLRTATNFDACVQYDYYKTEGSAVMTPVQLHLRRDHYYKRCWEAGEWLWRTPDVTDVCIMQQMKTEIDANMLEVDSRAAQATETTAAADSATIQAATVCRLNCTSDDTTKGPSFADQNEAKMLSVSAAEESQSKDFEAVPPSIAAAKQLQKPVICPAKDTKLATKRPIAKTKKKTIKSDSAKYVPQITHQYRPLAVNVVKRKPAALAGSTLTNVSNNNNNNNNNNHKVADWTPSQELASDNTLFNATALMAATTETPTEPSSTETAPKRIAQVIESVNSERLQQPERQLLFFHELVRFDFYKALTYDQIQRDLLYDTEIGKRYMQAHIGYGGRRTTIYGDFLNALFPQCPPALLNDFRYVLDSVGEYHYSVYERRDDIHDCDDQRKRVLFNFLQTRPFVSFCQLKFDSATGEYAKCSTTVRSYANSERARRPRRSLVSAMRPHILQEIKLLKSKLKN